MRTVVRKKRENETCESTRTWVVRNAERPGRSRARANHVERRVFQGRDGAAGLMQLALLKEEVKTAHTALRSPRTPDYRSV
jgi:hypothetical protein